jgi:hypothetical protein
MPLLEGLYPAAEKLGHNLIIVVTNTRFSSATELTIVIYYTIADLFFRGPLGASYFMYIYGNVSILDFLYW